MGAVSPRQPEAPAIAIVAFEGVQLLDVTGPAEVFTTARVSGPGSGPGAGCAYDVRIVSPDGADVVTSSGVRIGVHGSLDALPHRVDTVLVPGRRDWRAAVRDRDLVGFTTQLARRARRVASVCAGAFLLAEAGVLDGRRAATHWRLTGELATAYPAVTVADDPIFVRDGHVIMSAGISAGIDLSLALVEEDHGAATAREVARELVVFMARPGGQSQFSARLRPATGQHPAVRAAMDAAGADPHAASDLSVLADAAGVSPRHLTRLFRADTGMTPGQYVESVRLEAARALLEGGGASVEHVAREAGFGSAESVRRTFQQVLKVAPTEYRARFRSTDTA
ncbi:MULTISPECIES: GlxA family transcriptional regulator [unclassified Streptomyces]|uniref:GlxA family transcriptional regulator n=1 Tax=unclassified Streptomyces TaxID=2593676 RepID=UPI000DC36481|nr:GlxA family transcriptional regulator [Streptomyces sp. PsTaAH-137]RAJ72662.1 transcriptional regulator GlxA family with amidase domain [Streptomyces sp. PsTaAH-137]